MAGFHHDFTTTRETSPDQQTLQAQLHALDASAGVGQLGAQLYRVKKDTDWTAPQIAAAQNVIDTASTSTSQLRSVRTSRDKDVLATCALIVRARGIPAWNALTTPQKVAAATAEADVWVTIRDFLENNS